MRAGESPEGFTAAEVSCGFVSSDFISVAIHFDAERYNVGVLADVLYRLNCIFEDDVVVEGLK